MLLTFSSQLSKFCMFEAAVQSRAEAMQRIGWVLAQFKILSIGLSYWAGLGFSAFANTSWTFPTREMDLLWAHTFLNILKDLASGHGRMGCISANFLSKLISWPSCLSQVIWHSSLKEHKQGGEFDSIYHIQTRRRIRFNISHSILAS